MVLSDSACNKYKKLYHLKKRLRIQNIGSMPDLGLIYQDYLQTMQNICFATKRRKSRNILNEHISDL